MLRWAACAAVIAAGSGLGWWFGERSRQRVRQLEACDHFLARLQSRLTTERPTTRSLLTQAAESPRLAALTFLPLALEAMERGDPFPSAWAQALTASRDRMALSEEDYPPLEGLGEILGTSDGDRQAEELGLFRDLLHENLSAAREQQRVRGNLSTTLGFLGGTALGILLL